MEIKNIALLGNPNSGKSSVFNQLTGLNQQVGNYPGVTVDKKKGYFQLNSGSKVSVVDLPGTYSLFSRSEDEKVVSDFLKDKDKEDFPDALVVTVDSSNLERNLLLFTQVYDLNIPVVLLLNMMDISKGKGRSIDIEKLSQELGGVKVIPANARKGEGLNELKDYLENFQARKEHKPFYSSFEFLEQKRNEQIKESKIRYSKISQLLNKVVQDEEKKGPSLTEKLDKILVHPVMAFPIFLTVLFVIFQSVYSLSEYPMDLIDTAFAWLKDWSASTLPSGPFSDLISEGIVPGLGGIFIFIPQIALLFFFIALMEESGYMARVVFIMDKLMRPFGLNGRSVVPMISGMACAIPGIMAARTIDNWKDRMITIMITPLMSCAARLPVYAILIALVIPDESLGGFFNLKGMVLMGLYLIGIVMALGIALLFKLLMKSKKSGFLILELPAYKMPRWKNIGITIFEKSRLFVWNAGKIILAISIILWVMASYGPGNRMETAVSQIPLPKEGDKVALAQYKLDAGQAKLENSYIGILGKSIEPAITPLGYDWKIGISLITSFAAREVFVGTMATLYSVEDDGEENPGLQAQMKAAVNPATGLPLFNLATGISLMLFYAFAMQCMSTLAIVKRETKSWKWPAIQFAYMTALAYGSALIGYQIFS